MNEGVLWDVLGPVVILVFLAGIIWSVYGIKKKRFWPIFSSCLISFISAYVFAWSVGKFILVIAVLQLIISLYLLIKSNQTKQVIN
ncbi:hypothetical protein ACFSTA_10065 [Ornithinibacillus salinisoli]|uniref:Uncharacterized protein n=1 Tax=Ornithinibacillus salinisoli TaxID=1848459 RepID=A0ABW4VYP0_9BACI